MNTREELVEYLCGGHSVYGAAHIPDRHGRHGLIAIGQYGSTRMNVHLCRRAAGAGVPAFRFELRGRGWCEGPIVSVDQTNQDIATAVRTFQKAVPSVATFTVMGLSEGATAALLYAHTEPLITGIVLVNPWVRMEREAAKEHLFMNLRRIGNPDFWKRIRQTERGHLGAARSLSVLVRNVVSASPTTDTLKDRVLDGFTRFRGMTFLVLGGADPATKVFTQVTANHVAKLKAQRRLRAHEVPEADHVFSNREHRDQLIREIIRWTLENSEREIWSADLASNVS